MRTCSICGKVIRKADLCNQCLGEWGNKSKWVKELIKIQSHFERTKANEEVTFTDDGRELEEIFSVHTEN